MTPAEIREFIKEGYAWFRLYNGIIMAILSETQDEGIFWGAFVPCSKNSHRYVIEAEKIKESLGRVVMGFIDLLGKISMKDLSKVSEIKLDKYGSLKKYANSALVHRVISILHVEHV
jgi:hypothetical protein